MFVCCGGDAYLLNAIGGMMKTLLICISMALICCAFWLGFFSLLGCSARFQNATSLEWGEQLESNDSSVSIEEKKFVNQQGVI